jgi:hypothetical protein
MTRTPTDVAHINLRLRESLRHKLEVEAKRHQVNLNSEMIRRLESSFDDKPRDDFATVAQKLNQIVTELDIAWTRLEGAQQSTRADPAIRFDEQFDLPGITDR